MTVQLEAAVRRSSDYRRLAQAWSRCMAGRGLAYRSPRTMISLTADRDVSFARERRIALAHTRCANETGFAQRVATALAHARTLAPAVRQRLEAWDVLRATADESAREVLERADVDSVAAASP